MKYVTDLLAVQPEEIERVNCLKVLYIRDNGPKAPETSRVTVVYLRWEDTFPVMQYYSIDGRLYPGGAQLFNYKPKKVKYLKPLHKILAKNPDYECWGNGVINFPGMDTRLLPLHLGMLGKPIKENFTWPESFIEEREE